MGYLSLPLRSGIERTVTTDSTVPLFTQKNPVLAGTGYTLEFFSRYLPIFRFSLLLLKQTIWFSICAPLLSSETITIVMEKLPVDNSWTFSTLINWMSWIETLFINIVFPLNRHHCLLHHTLCHVFCQVFLLKIVLSDVIFCYRTLPVWPLRVS